MQHSNGAHAFGRAMTFVMGIFLSCALALSMLVPAFAIPSSAHESKAQQYAESSSEKQAEAAEIKAQIDELQTKINEATAAYEAALAEHDAALAAEQEANARVVAAEERIAELQEHLKERATSMYRSGGETNIVDVLLGSSSFESFLKSWDAMERINEQDARWIEEKKQSRIVAYESRDEAAAQRQLAEAKMEEAEQARIEVALNQAAMEQTLSKVNQEIALLDSLQEEEEMAAEEARRLEAEAARLASQKFNSGGSTPSASISAEGWTHPLPGARVSSEYGTRTHPVTGQVYSFHSGIDLAAPLGTPVGAAKAGTVAYVGWYGTGGNAIIVNHGDGVRTVYMHLNSFNTHVGATVEPGECIGYVGTTGRSTGPHLHFNVEINQTPINPRAILSF